MPTTDGEGRAGELLERFLAERSDRTQQAYTADLDDFARFRSGTPEGAVAELLAGGADAGRDMAIGFVLYLRRRDRAHATIDRRLSTLRALIRSAHDLGMVDWRFEVPTEEEITAATEGRPGSDSEHYLVPRHPGEVDRLDVQHYALRETLQANYLAPIADPRRVLDVGSGTGQWGFEMCVQHPAALVVGLDLVAGKPVRPAGYRQVNGNLLHGLPFRADRFDFVHQRLLVAGIPLAAWPGVVADLVRVTRPGGWVELVEVQWEIEGAGPATRQLSALMMELTAAMGLDTSGRVFHGLQDFLQDAGLVNVERREVGVPVGLWGGQVGSLMVTDLRAGITRVTEVLQMRGRVTAEETRALIQEAQPEWEQGRLSYPFAFAFGQKPA